MTERDQIESLMIERAMLVVALESIDRHARQGIFGGWHHIVGGIAGAALDRAALTEAARKRCLATKDTRP